MDKYYNEKNFPVRLPDTGGNWILRADSKLKHVAYIARDPDPRSGCFSGGFGPMAYTMQHFGDILLTGIYRKGDF
jgi:hypothetical protein